jgi:hypothetical protein
MPWAPFMDVRPFPRRNGSKHAAGRVGKKRAPRRNRRKR